jgi:hypothetical protein
MHFRNVAFEKLPARVVSAGDAQGAKTIPDIKVYESRNCFSMIGAAEINIRLGHALHGVEALAAIPSRPQL